MARKVVKAGEPKLADVKPEALYAVEVLKPIDISRGFKVLPRHTNVKLGGKIILAHPTAVKVIGEIKKDG